MTAIPHFQSSQLQFWGEINEKQNVSIFFRLPAFQATNVITEGNDSMYSYTQSVVSSSALLAW